MHPQNPPKAIICDLGDVLFTWSPDTTTTLPPKTIHGILSSPIWMEYETGHTDQDACYHQVAQQLSVPVAEIAEAFSQAGDSLQPNDAMVSFLCDLKDASRGVVKVYAMSNVSKEDYVVLSTKMVEWSVFDRVFTSGHAGMRKPDLSFYRYVLQETKLAPEEAVFIDDKNTNVLAAKSLGINGILFDDTSKVARTLSNVFGGPVGKGYEFLYRNAKRFDSITESGVVVPENLSQLMILDATQDRNLVNIEQESKRTWNFFSGEHGRERMLIQDGYFPDDLDTTSLALQVLRHNPDVITSVLDEMLEYVNADGTVQTYFDRNKPRTDPVVSANVLACFYSFGRGQQLGRTLQLIHDVLLNRTYIHGTGYYTSPDCCLFFFGRLLQSSADTNLKTTLRPLLKERTQERVGQSGNALDLAMRILTCNSLDLNYGLDRRALLDLQCEDGGWEGGWLYQYGSTGVKLGNRGVTTALAIKAIASPEKLSGVE